MSFSDRTMTEPYTSREVSTVPGEGDANLLLQDSKAAAPYSTQKAPFQFSTGRGQHCAKLSGVYNSILPKLKSAKSSTRSVRLGATGAAVSASRGA